MADRGAEEVEGTVLGPGLSQVGPTSRLRLWAVLKERFPGRCSVPVTCEKLYVDL